MIGKDEWTLDLLLHGLSMTWIVYYIDLCNLKKDLFAASISFCALFTSKVAQFCMGGMSTSFTNM